MTDKRVFPVFIGVVGGKGRGGVKTVRGLWAKGGHGGEVPSRNRGGLGLPKFDSFAWD